MKKVNLEIDAIDVLVRIVDGIRDDDSLTPEQKKDAETAMNMFIKAVHKPRKIVGAGAKVMG